MKIAAIADIHANAPALRAVLVDAHLAGANKIICLGDLVGYGPFPDETVTLIRAAGITCVQGNYDEAVANDRLVCGCDFASEQEAAIGAAAIAWAREHTSSDSRAFLRSLPHELLLELAGYRLHCFHGSPQSQTEYLRQDISQEYLAEIAYQSSGDVLLFGHTHLPYHRIVAGKHFINAGSVGKPKHGDSRASYMLIRLERQVQSEVRYVPYPVAETLDAMRRAGLSEELAQKIASGQP